MKSFRIRRVLSKTTLKKELHDDGAFTDLSNHAWAWISYRWVKSRLDEWFASLLFLLLSPLFIIIAILIRLESPGPILYSAARIGLNGKPIAVFRFRIATLSSADGQRGEVTAIGRLLLRTSLNEFPLLLNVIGGDLSLVGPRPASSSEAAHYTPEQRKRLSVKPGLTGLWQTSSRAMSSYEDMIKCDLTYVKNLSLALDFAILCRTIAAVFGESNMRWVVPALFSISTAVTLFARFGLVMDWTAPFG